MAITKLTSIKLLENVYKAFKVVSFQNGYTLQKVVNRCLYKYTNDMEFRHLIENATELQVSGSNF